MPILETILGANIGQMFKDVVGSFKLSPEKKAEMQEAIDQNQAVLEQKQIDLESKAQDAVAAEVQQSAEIIKLEAQSQSWLPRNVRPLLLLLWGLTITFNIFVPIVARFWVPNLQPLILPDWVYKLTAIGYTGYVGFRTWEKLSDKN